MQSCVFSSSRRKKSEHDCKSYRDYLGKSGRFIPGGCYTLSVNILVSMLVFPMVGCRHSVLQHGNMSRFSLVECTFLNIPKCVHLPVGVVSIPDAESFSVTAVGCTATYFVARYLMMCLVFVKSHLFPLPCGAGSTVLREGLT